MKLFLLFVFNLIFYVSYTQSDVYGIEGRYKSGFLLAHRGVMAHLPQHMAHTTEISLYRKPGGNKNWHKAYNYPQHGMTFIFGSVGNNDVLGYLFGSYGYIELPIVKRNDFLLDWKFGFGVAYSSKKYDPISNPKNAAIGSHINALGCLGVRASYFFNRQKLTLGVDMTHFSNGAYKVPNLGVNVPFVSIGYGHDIVSFKRDSTLFQDDFNRKWNFGITAIASAKQLNLNTDRHYPVYAMDLFARKNFTQKAGLELAMNFVSNQSLRETNSNEMPSQKDILQMGLYAAYILPMDCFHFVFGMGAYVKNKLMPSDPLYHRIGMRYIFNNGIHAHMVLKTHYARADYFELGIGYTFKSLFNK